MSSLDFQQVITQAGDDPTKSLRVLTLGPGGAPAQFDFVARSVTTTTVANDTEVFNFKVGGSSGTTVYVWTLVYETSSLASLLTATRN